MPDQNFQGLYFPKKPGGIYIPQANPIFHPRDGKKLNVIFDGDWGGDDFWALMSTLGYSEHFNIIGITTCFGNVDGDHAAQNVLNFCSEYNIRIPIYKGADRPIKGSCMFGDNAYGDDGVGGVVYGRADRQFKLQDQTAVDFIIQAVKNSQDPIVIFSTGPLTNIARVIQKDPEIAHKLHVIAFAGSIKPGPYPNPEHRIGNLTEYSEFNLAQDPYAFNIVAQSDANLIAFTLDASQKIHLDQDFRDQFNRVSTNAEFIRKSLRIIDSVAELDKRKYGVTGSFLHDVQVPIFSLFPHFYRAFFAETSAIVDPPKGYDETSNHGRMVLKNHFTNSVIVSDMQQPDMVKHAILRGMQNFAKLCLP
jgi:inosine-uridine nucleoside N-ribohydrolase